MVGNVMLHRMNSKNIKYYLLEKVKTHFRKEFWKKFKTIFVRLFMEIS